MADPNISIIRRCHRITVIPDCCVADPSTKTMLTVTGSEMGCLRVTGIDILPALSGTVRAVSSNPTTTAREVINNKHKMG